MQIVSLPIALLVMLALIFLLQLDSLLRASPWANHADAVIRQASLVKESLLAQQVSIRGYPIAPGEYERCLRRYRRRA